MSREIPSSYIILYLLRYIIIIIRFPWRYHILFILIKNIVILLSDDLPIQYVFPIILFYFFFCSQDRDIYLMVTSAGKIVFVSHSVENILGHPQVSFSWKWLSRRYVYKWINKNWHNMYITCVLPVCRTIASPLNNLNQLISGVNELRILFIPFVF